MEITPILQGGIVAIVVVMMMMKVVNAHILPPICLLVSVVYVLTTVLCTGTLIGLKV